MHAKRRLGQNFLIHSHHVERIVAAVRPQAGETIMEIGPGHGALTELLVESGARVVAIEIDKDLIPMLTSGFSARDNFKLIEADAMKTDFCEAIAPAQSARVVANLPYYISTPILQRLIEHRRCISEMTLMLQREVVERIAAAPGGKEYGYLSVLVQLYCEAEKLFDVPPGAFRPVPKVVSSVMRLRVRPQTAVDVENENLLLELAKTLFAQRRKTILNNLKAGRGRLAMTNPEQPGQAIAAAGLDPKRRAETLTLAELARMANCVGELNECRS